MIISKKSNHIWTFLITVFSFVSFCIFATLNFYRDPGSIFFDGRRANERQYSLQREEQAKAFEQEVYAKAYKFKGATPLKTIKVGAEPKICVIIPTVKRDTGKSKSSVNLVVTSLLAGLTKPEREDLDLRVYFANTDPESHPLWKQPWLLNLADNSTTARDLVSQNQLEALQDYESRGKFLGAKILLDYAYALQYAYDTSTAPYIGIFEDDVIFADGWLARALLALQTVEKKCKASGKDWIDLRMFNAENNIGFASNAWFGNNVPWIILGVSSLAFAVLQILYFKTGIGAQIVTLKLCLMVCLFTIPLFVVTFFQAGKSSMLPPSAGVVVQDWGLGTQASILPRHQIPHIIERLSERRDAQPDIAIKELAHVKHLQRFVLNPVQVQHLGYKSSSAPGHEYRYGIWSIAFESLSPKRLVRDHRRMVTELYGHFASSNAATPYQSDSAGAERKEGVRQHRLSGGSVKNSHWRS